MSDINHVIISGRLTGRPVVRTTPAGKRVATLRIAINERHKVKDEWHEKATFVDATVWGASADEAEHIDKGNAVFIDGRLEMEEWTDKAGQARSKLKVTAIKTVFFGGAVTSPETPVLEQPKPEASDDLPW